MRLFIHQHQSPGDILALTAAVRDLKASHPDIAINVSTTAQELWWYNPNLDRTVNELNADRVITSHYDLIHTSNTSGLHIIDCFRMDLEQQLGLCIAPGARRCDVHLTDDEKEPSYARAKTGIDHGYWLVNAGHKRDFTAKQWSLERYQEVVDRTRHRITWVQIGSLEHEHRPLRNCVCLLGKTTHRELLRLMYRAGGVLTGISYPMHLSTMPMPVPCRQRPCVVVAGGREPATFTFYTNHQFLHTCGMLPCCDNGGCWKSRTIPLNDGDEKDGSLCLHPTQTPSGQTVPLCMDRITTDMVVARILDYCKYENTQNKETDK